MNKRLLGLLFLICTLPFLDSWGQTVAPTPAKPAVITPAADAAKALKMVLDALGKQRALYGQVKTLEYTADSVRLDNNHPPDIQPSKLHFLSKGEFYYYEYNPVEYPGKEYAHYTSSYDGNDARKLNTISRHMTIKKGRGDDGGTLFLNNFLFLPQKFFSVAYNPSVGTVTKPAELADPAKWSDFLKKIQVLGESTLLNQNCVVVQFGLDKEPFTERAAKVRIYLDLAAEGFPMGWDLLTPSDEPILTYRVNKLALCPIGGTPLFLPYPEKATRASYITSEGQVTKLPEGTASITVHSIRINQDLDDDLFTIDPSSANDIHDLDDDKFIIVPH